MLVATALDRVAAGWRGSSAHGIFLALSALLVGLAAPVGNAGTQSMTVLHTFDTFSEGTAATDGLVADKTGALYGVASTGGSRRCYLGCGLVFRLTPPRTASGRWRYTVLHTFQGDDGGAYPQGRLLLGADGALYGVTSAGGTMVACSSGCGTVFRLKPRAQNDWQHETIHRFEGKKDGARPFYSLVTDAAGNLYGTTTYGGSAPKSYKCGPPGQGCGTVFKLAPPRNANASWTESILHVFDGDNGQLPFGITLGPKGVLYGVVPFRGQQPCGTGRCQPGVAFSLTPPRGSDDRWRYAVIYEFGDRISDPGTTLTRDERGDLYGMAGGPADRGVVFRLRHARDDNGTWTYESLFSFTETSETATFSELAVDQAGALFGTSRSDEGRGIVFKLQAGKSGGDWKRSELSQFADKPVFSPLLLGKAGSIFGVAADNANSAIAFELAP
jgi:uncharacterized repeat protein (TIGR03803 family)